MKDEGLLPTGAFKARGAAVGVSRAAELGVTGIAMPTNGNAGAAWAAYAARAGLRRAGRDAGRRPGDHPARVRGRRRRAVPGRRADRRRRPAGRRRRSPSRDGYQDTSTLREPYRIEGKKTMGYEIVEQLGWRCPDVHPLPDRRRGRDHRRSTRRCWSCGSWAGSPATCPGWSPSRRPGCAPIVDAFDAGLDESTPPADPHTVAFGITVPKALGDFLVLDAVRSTGGTAVAVDRRGAARRAGRAGPRRGRLDLPGGRGLLRGGRAAARVGVAGPATRTWSC